MRNTLVQHESGVVEMSVQQLRKLKTLDFNRKFKESYISNMSADLKSTGEIPPIMEVGLYKGELYIVDGQLRVFSCLEANLPAKVNVRTYRSIEEMRIAVDKYRRVKKYTAAEVINLAVSNTSKQVLKLAQVYPASTLQVKAILDAIKKTDNGYSDPEERFSAVILESITKDSRFVQLNPNFKGTIEGAISSKDTLFCLTKFCLPHLKNLNAVKSRVKCILDADWTKKTSPFRTLQGTTNRKELINAMNKFWNSKV